MKRFEMLRAVVRGSIDETRALLDAGGDPNAHPRILVAAVERGSVEMVELLLSRGADARRVDADGWSAATVADAEGFTALADRLVAAGAPASSRFAHGYSQLHRAARRGATEFEGAVDVLDARGDTPLMLATVFRHQASADALLRLGANPNHATRGHAVLDEAAYQDSRPDEPTHFVTSLLAAGAQPTSASLFFTVNQEWSSPAVLRQLGEAGADIRGVDADQQTVLHRIAEITGAEMIDAALELGADIEARDALGRTPLLCSIDNDAAFNWLVKRGADVLARDAGGRSVAEMRAKP